MNATKKEDPVMETAQPVSENIGTQIFNFFLDSNMILQVLVFAA